ncbi:hypothetical protein [Curtobacterium sp. VKM Ac-2922]|uniref:hypothetical protein n=1 Tax=Curtobacterium sp. VKM Ac-2922 TaxID=2929475 RepID=UPI001FB1E07C|nr:hypothetical protein [Curtobacterium sp. VKM Ac-2922]MCJ1715873.1 hypothetical protein [Curtobacterium sp. VKM Ac-2922]
MSTITAIAPGIPATIVVPGPLLEATLSGLERTGARLPHALAVPVMLAHAAIATVAYR